MTTSYVSPAMQELEADAKKAGITVMNEIGLDPVSLAFTIDGIIKNIRGLMEYN